MISCGNAAVSAFAAPPDRREYTPHGREWDEAFSLFPVLRGEGRGEGRATFGDEQRCDSGDGTANRRITRRCSGPAGTVSSHRVGDRDRPHVMWLDVHDG